MLRFSACLLAAVPVAAMAAPAEPTGKWVMDYAPTACTAKRAFGDRAVAITPSPLGVTTRIMLDVPGRATGASHVYSAIDPGDGRGRIVTTSIIFPTSRKGFRGIYTVVPIADAQRVLDSGRLTLITGRNSEREMISDRAIDLTGGSFNLGKMGALNKALDTCMADLRKRWNIVDGTIVPPANRTRSIGDVRSVFRAEDYPEDARARDLKGVTQFTLMIDEQGRVADCLITQTSGVGVLDAMGCQVLRERARFTPATDAQGKPVADLVVTPVVRWVLN